jgi:dienelactone hydrolase
MQRRVTVLSLLAACGGGQGPIAPTRPPAAPAAPAPVAPAPAAPAVEPTAPLEAILALPSHAGGRLSADGARLFFLSDRDGIRTLYAAGAADPEAAPERLVPRDQRVADYLVTAGGGSIVFRSDTGGDGSWSIFRVGVDGRDLVELTPGDPRDRGPMLEPEGAPGRLYFAARRHDEVATEIVELPLAGGAGRVVTRFAREASLLDVSPDGRALAVAHGAAVELVDVASGEARPLRAAAAIHPTGAIFTAGGGLVVTGNGADDRPRMLLLTRAGRVAARREEAGGGAFDGGCVASPRRDRIACALLAAGRTELRVYDARTLRPRAAPRLPEGSGAVSGYSPDGARLLVTWSTPGAPDNVFAVDEEGEAIALRAAPRGVPPVDVTFAGVRAHDGLDLPVNVYRPGGARAPAPVLLHLHAGPAGVARVAWSSLRAAYLAHGYVVVEPNLRGSTGFGRAFEVADNRERRVDSFRDLETVTRWVAAQPWADRDRLVALGVGHGGTLALVGLSRLPELFRAGVVLSAPSDLVSFLQATAAMVRERMRVEIGDLEKDRELLESLSPLRDVGRIVDPLFVYHGARDPFVPRSESDQLVLALQRRGVPVEVMVAEDEGHSIARRATAAAFLGRSLRFLSVALR